MTKKIHRFIWDFGNQVGDSIEITDKETVHQIKNVLKLKIGEKIILSNGNGGEVEGVLKEVRKTTIMSIDSRQTVEPLPTTSLLVAIVKRDNWEWIVQKAVEIGITKIVPLVTERTIKTNLNYERLNKIAKEAAEQSGQSYLPNIVAAMDFEDAIKAVKIGEVNIFLEKDGVKMKKPLERRDETVNIWVGPEGGWSEEEVETAKSKQMQVVSLGVSTLRAETAAITGAYFFSHFSV